MPKHLLFLLLGGLAWLPLAGQWLPNGDFAQLETRACPFDSTAQITQPEGWLIYQTLDGAWDGPADSARCFNAANIQPGGAYTRVDLSEADFSKPVFVRCRLQDFPKIPVREDWIYTMSLNFGTSPGLSWKIGSDCASELCTGLAAGMAIPTPDFSDPIGNTRYHTGQADPPPPNPQNTVCAGRVQACLPSEYFAGTQFLREFIFKITLLPDSSASERFLDLYVAEWIEHWEPPAYLEHFAATPFHWQNGAYEVPLWEVATSSWGWPGSTIARYADHAAFPSAANHYYIEAAPEQNTPDPQTINLTVDPFQTLLFQPFVQLRGGKVAGSDSVRHHLNLVNNGGNLCLNFIDLIFTGGDRYIHNGGDLDIHNAFSCLQFRRGSALRVARGQTLHYGENGAGMLALCAGGSLELEENATLVVDAIMNLSECDPALPSQQIYMDLPPGARLVFTENAWLTNRFSLDRQMMLNVRMLGGTLDDALLPPDARALIRRVWPAPSANFSENVVVAPNPFWGDAEIRLNAAAAGPVGLRFFDASGRMIFEKTAQAAEGMNSWPLPLPAAGLPPGMYFLAIESGGQRAVVKMARAE